MSTRMEPKVLVRHPDVLGESPAWDPANARLLWVDMFGQRVHELTWADDSTWKTGRTWEIEQNACAVVPRKGGGLMVGRKTDFVALSDSGEVEVFAALDADPLADVHLNDAKCDPQGRLVAGWRTDDLGRPGALVRLDPDGSIETILTDLGLANGLDWSPDGETFYLVDSAAMRVDAFDYEVGPGTIGDRRTVVSIERGIGAPNGIATDREGCLWVALTYTGEIRRYSSEGNLLETIVTPTRKPTSCAFGGPEGCALFITSASFTVPSSVAVRLGITPDRIAVAERDENGGALFVCWPSVSGPPATPFGG